MQYKKLKVRLHIKSWKNVFNKIYKNFYKEFQAILS